MGERGATTEIIRAERFDFWQEVVCRTLYEGDCLDARADAFHGEISTTRSAEVSFSRVHSVGQRFQRTPHHARRSQADFFGVLLQVSGQGLIAQDGRDAFLEPGDLTCTDSTRPATFLFAESFEQLVVLLPRQLVVGHLGPTDGLTAHRCGLQSPMGSIVSPFLRHAAAALGHVKQSTAERLGEIGVSLIVTMLAELCATPPGDARWARAALRYRADALIHAHARDHALNSEAVAAALRMSARYLQDLFRDEHTTPSERIWHWRLQESRRDLMDPSLARLNISEIALRSGFLDFAHFSRRFKSAFGISPREFREQHCETRISRRIDV